MTGFGRGSYEDADFSVNIESAAQAGIDTAILWQYQDKDAEKLTKVGIPTLLIYNDTVENLKKIGRKAF